MSRSPSAGLALAGVLLAVLPACDTADALARRCAQGDAAACKGACDQDVFGEGGCFQAGQAAYREAGTDFEGPEWRRARKLFDRSCTGGHADGCLFAAQMLEVPFAAPRKEKGAPTATWPVIDDATIDARAALLERSCALGSTKGCERLGDVSIGKKREVALTGYARACERGESGAECLRAREREISAFEHYREGCRRGVADDCTALGNLVTRVDFPRAVRIFLAEADLRGVAERSGGHLAFVEQRIAEARSAPVVDPTAAAPPAPAPEGVAVELSSPVVKGRLAALILERALAAARPRIARCAAGRIPEAGLHFSARLVVDRTGDVWSGTLHSDDAPAEVAACVLDVLRSVTMEPPVSGIADVEQSFSIFER
jgi:hypothetical protein